MCAQARPWFILSSKRVLKEWSQKPSPLPEAQRRFKPAMLYHTGQWVQHTTDWAIPVPAYHLTIEKTNFRSTFINKMAVQSEINNSTVFNSSQWQKMKSFSVYNKLFTVLRLLHHSLFMNIHLSMWLTTDTCLSLYFTTASNICLFWDAHGNQHMF